MLPKRTRSALQVLAFGMLVVAPITVAHAAEHAPQPTPDRAASGPGDKADASQPDAAGADTGKADADGADRGKANADGADADAANADGADADAADADGADAAASDDTDAAVAASDDSSEPDATSEGDDDDDDDEGDDDDDAEPSNEPPTPEQLAEEREAKKREILEDANPRPTPLTEIGVPRSPPWRRRLEIGGSAALVIRPLSEGLGPSQVRYRPAIAWGLHLNWPVLPWLRVRPYFLDAHHSLDIPQGALVTSASNSISQNAQLSEATTETFVFGAKVAPTLDITDRFRVWLSAGVGWGRFEFQEITVTEPDGGTYRVRERAGTMLEFPMGLGVAFDIWPRWLALEYEVSAAPFVSQSGNAYESAQAVDDDGQLRDVGPLGAVELSVVQTLGLSLIL